MTPLYIPGRINLGADDIALAMRTNQGDALMGLVRMVPGDLYVDGRRICSSAEVDERTLRRLGRHGLRLIRGGKAGA